VQVLFRTFAHEVAQNETLPLRLIRMREPYIDLEPVSAAPLKPGGEQDFRLIFDAVTRLGRRLPGDSRHPTSRQDSLRCIRHGLVHPERDPLSTRTTSTPSSPTAFSAAASAANGGAVVMEKIDGAWQRKSRCKRLDIVADFLSPSAQPAPIEECR